MTLVILCNLLCQRYHFFQRLFVGPLSIESDRILIRPSLIKQKHMASSKNYGGSLGLGMAGYLWSNDIIRIFSSFHLFVCFSYVDPYQFSLHGCKEKLYSLWRSFEICIILGIRNLREDLSFSTFLSVLKKTKLKLA